MTTPDAGVPVAVEHDLAVDLYRQMALIKRFEQVAYRAYEGGDIGGTIHVSIGQEGTAVGVISALRESDKLLSHHRGHGHALAKGVDPGRLMAELCGRSTGVSGGKGGSMHATDVECGFLGTLAVVGSSIPLAVGVALALRRAGSDAVCVAFFGDGAVNQGVLYESFNLAAIWDLPVMFVCENNSYAISTPARGFTAGEGAVARALSFGLAAEAVDGQDVLAVRAATMRLTEAVRAGQPALLECMTYRFMGHSRGDPAHGLYRTKEEVDAWLQRDPLKLLAREAQLGEDLRERLDDEARDRIAAALDFALASPRPAVETLDEDVWG
jgi:pyruvate dehydrogenase E1 component alpha subunit